MLDSQEVRDEIAAEWRALEDMVELARWSWTEVDVGYGQFDHTRALAVSSLNLCVLFGVSVLERFLLRLRGEGLLATNDSSLYGLMQASRVAGMPCRNFRRIESIRQKRNEIAHRRAPFSESECPVMLLAISDELKEQSIVSPRNRLFMDSLGLHASNAAGRPFRLEMCFPADVDRMLQSQIFDLAKVAALEVTETEDIESRLKKTLPSIGLPTDIKYTVEFRFETSEDNGRIENGA